MVQITADVEDDSFHISLR